MSTTSLKKLASVGRRTAPGALVVLAAPYFISFPASAQEWTVVNLHPAGAAASTGNDVADGQQGGLGGYWTGTAESFVSLGPLALVYGVGSGQQAGRFVDGNLRACVWSGSAESRVVLHPAGAFISEATDTHNGMQVGWVGQTGTSPPHAVLWNSSAASMVDLHPAGPTLSQALGIHGGQQVGNVRYSTGLNRAALWNGSAASFVDLHPGVGTISVARGTDGVEQVGSVQFATFHAALWRGSAATFVDLHPPGAYFSNAHGVAAGQQVGSVTATEESGARATIWSGSAATALDLHSFLPADFTSSVANGIWHDGAVTYVVGTGYNNTNARNEALMWIRCNGPLAGDLDADGDVDLADLALLLASFGCTPPQNCDADIDADGDVDLADLSFVLSNFGEVCR
jgi:hypothetical protein